MKQIVRRKLVKPSNVLIVANVTNTGAQILVFHTVRNHGIVTLLGEMVGFNLAYFMMTKLIELLRKNQK